MPFQSQSQRAWMYANKPEMAARWQKETPKGAELPDHVSNSDQQKRLRRPFTDYQHPSKKDS